MNRVEPPLRNPGDDIDALLRTYMRRQMPQPWPASPLSAPCGRETEPRRGKPTSGPLIRSRWALAASIALLLLSSLLLPQRLTPPLHHWDGDLDVPLLNDNGIRRRMEKEHQKREFEKENQASLGVEDGDLFHDLDDSDMLPVK